MKNKNDDESRYNPSEKVNNNKCNKFDDFDSLIEKLNTLFPSANSKNILKLMANIRLSDAKKCIEEPNSEPRQRIVVSKFGSLTENIRIAQRTPIDIIPLKEKRKPKTLKESNQELVHTIHSVKKLVRKP